MQVVDEFENTNTELKVTRDVNTFASSCPFPWLLARPRVCVRTSMSFQLRRAAFAEITRRWALSNEMLAILDLSSLEFTRNLNFTIDEYS